MSELEIQVERWAGEVVTPPFSAVSRRAARAKRRRLAAGGAAVAVVVATTAGTVAAITSARDGRGAHVVVVPASGGTVPAKVLLVRQSSTGKITRMPPHTHQVRTVNGGTFYAVADTPVATLHITSATVRPVASAWSVELVTNDAPSFNLGSHPGQQFVVEVKGGVVRLLFVEGSADGARFSLLQPNPPGLSKEAALQIARSVTADVAVQG